MPLASVNVITIFFEVPYVVLTAVALIAVATGAGLTVNAALLMLSENTSVALNVAVAV